MTTDKIVNLIDRNTADPIQVSSAVMHRFRPGDVPLVEQYMVWCRRKNFALTTTRQKVAGLAKLADHYPHVPLLDVTSEQVEASLDARRGRFGGPIQPKSRKTAISVLAVFYKWANDFDHTNNNPMRQVVAPRVGSEVPTPVSENDFALAVANAATPTMRLWLLLGGAVGLRCAEIAGLLWEGIDSCDKSLRVIGKGSRERIVPLIDRVVLELDGHERSRTDSPFVFTDPVFDRKYQPAQISKMIGVFFAEIGMTYTAHDLRHRFGTEACESSGDIRAVQVLMGHSSVESTATYTLVRDHRRRQIVDGMRKAA